MPTQTRPCKIKRFGGLCELPCHVDENDHPTRFMRREWKYNKPHLRRSNSLPTLSIFPSTRPHFTCRQCHFTNTILPMCLWCCWTSKESEALFEKSMPRARRMSTPMRISSEVGTSRKKRITEANSSPGQRRKVIEGVRTHSVDTVEPTKDGIPNPVISLNRLLPLRGYRKGTKNGNSLDISDGRGSNTRIGVVSRKRGASCSRTGFIGGAAGIEGGSSPRRSGEENEGGVVVQKGVGQRMMKSPIKAKSCVDISQSSKPGKFYESTTLGQGSTTNVSTTPTINDRPPLPLRIRRLKEVATPLQIDSQAKIPVIHATLPTPSPQSPATTRKLPLSPKIFRRMHNFSINYSPSKWPSCISDAEMSSAEDDRRFTIPNLPSRSTSCEGRLPTTAGNTTKKTTPSQFHPAYSITPPTPRSPWSKSDPFGELLGLGTDTITSPIPTPTSSLTNMSTASTPITPNNPAQAGVTRPRAATVSGYDPYNRSPNTPASPSSSVYSFSSHPQKPIYASLRKDGMYLSPLSSPRLPNSPSKATINPTPVDGVNRDAHKPGKGNNSERLAPSLYPCSPQPSPLSSVFPPHSNPTTYGDANLSSLSLESRSSSTEGSCGGDGIFVDAFDRSLMRSCGGGQKSGLMEKWINPQRKVGDVKYEGKGRRMGLKLKGRSMSKDDASMSSLGIMGGKMGQVGGTGTEQTRMPLSTSNPTLANQRLFRVPFATSGFGYSMSGETELKLSLRAKAMHEEGVQLGQEATVFEVDDPTIREKSSFYREDRHGIESRTKHGAGPMKRLREMVSTGFLRHGDGT